MSLPHPDLEDRNPMQAVAVALAERVRADPDLGEWETKGPVDLVYGGNVFPREPSGPDPRSVPGSVKDEAVFVWSRDAVILKDGGQQAFVDGERQHNPAAFVGLETHEMQLHVRGMVGNPDRCYALARAVCASLESRPPDGYSAIRVRGPWPIGTDAGGRPECAASVTLSRG